ncbi:MAG: Gfo/Idh/MocA family protein [Sphingobacterium sp.]|uniref:Gfo/Idh/MocA family protein n=1 Tax=Sphingobacterium sp. JB170 TaxID=1434842 RepID=UPI00097EC413|nr:Gfo/Idh/MocA family oxidoreductase [Sphingobacterium sp. JB170]SJN38832.1 Myo-inositol 2-dehydrogenase [Sphingobacterium sp. JB170]
MQLSNTGFAIIGTGAIAHIHAEVIQSIIGAELIGVYNRTASKAQTFADQYNCVAYESLQTMLENQQITIVCICTASGAHLEPALACISANKHCLIEKPLEITVERCKEIIDAAKVQGVRVATIFPSRFHPSSRQIKQALDQGHFGDLVLGSAYVKWSREEAYYNSAPWRGTWTLDGGGALMNQGIHALDLLQWYMGSVESVFAYAVNRRHKNIEVEDTVIATIKFTSGAVGSIECTTAAYPGSLKKIEIVGTEASVVLEENNILNWQFADGFEAGHLKTGSVSRRLAKGGASQPMNISSHGHRLQIEEFLSSLHKGVLSHVEGEAGVVSVEIISAIYESVRSGSPILLAKHTAPR